MPFPGQTMTGLSLDDSKRIIKCSNCGRETLILPGYYWPTPCDCPSRKENEMPESIVTLVPSHVAVVCHEESVDNRY